MSNWPFARGIPCPRLTSVSRFTDFLYSFVLPESEQPVDSQSSQYQQKEAYYINQIRELCTHNYQSLEVSFMHISTYDPQLAIWLADEPRIILQYLKDVLLPLSSLDSY